MHPRLIDAKAPGCPWPMCDVTTGRRDGTLVDFGEMAPVVANAPGREPRALIKGTRVELVAKKKLGMVPKKRHEKALAQIAELEGRIAELETEIEPLRETSATVERLLAPTTEE